MAKRNKTKTKALSLTSSFLNTYFDHIYVVNLTFKISDRLIITEHLNKHIVDFEIFEATNGFAGEPLDKFKEYQKRELGDFKRYLEYSEIEKEKGHPYIESAGAMGYIYTYLRILKDAKKSGYKRFIILEDDILLSENFETEFKNFIQSVDEDWKILQLGASQYSWDSVDIDSATEKGFYFPRSVDTCGSFAIAFDSTIVDELIEAESALEAPFDHLPMGELYERYSGKCFVAYPNIVMPDVSDSSIRGKRDQYTHSERMEWKIENFDYPLRKPSISVIITSKDNLKYYSNFSKTPQLPFNLRLFFNSSDGLRPLHNIELLDDEKNRILSLDKNIYLPESDYTVSISEDEVLTESDIVKFIEYKLNIRKKNETSLKELKPDRKKIQKERVSVIIPTYKRPKNLKSALGSVVEQDYPDIEVLVVCDNGGDSEFTEETRQIVSSSDGKNANCNVVLLEHSVNRNGAAARNTGVLNSTGEYICFLDDDDVYLPGRLSKSIEALKTTNKTVGAVYCGYFDDNSPENDLNRYKSGDLTLDILLLKHSKNYLNTDTATYKREAVLSINGFDESYYGHQELEFNLRFFEQYTVEVIRKTLVRIEAKDTDNMVDDLSIVESRQKFLNQFSYIIEAYGHDLEKSIYEIHWAEAKRFIFDKNALIDKISQNNKDGFFNVLKDKYDTDTTKAVKQIADISSKNTLLENELTQTHQQLHLVYASASYRLGHTLLHEKKVLVNPRALLRKFKTVTKMGGKNWNKTIAFCIPIMNREEDIKATLAHNLEIIEKFNGRVKVYINCFDNNNSVSDWIKENFSDIKYRKLLHFTSRDPLIHWHFSWAKNSFKDIITEDYYSSLDGDNFLSFEEIEFMLNLINENENIIFHGFSGQWGDGTSGRLTIPSDLYNKYGYDDTLYPRQFDELGFILNLLSNEKNIVFYHYKDANFLEISAFVKKYIALNNISIETVSIKKRDGFKAPLNGKGKDYTKDDPVLKYYQEFNAALTGLKLSNNHAAKEYYKDKLNEAVDLLDSTVLKTIIKKSFTFDTFLDISNDITIYSVIKNDSLFLKDWEKHYESLGVERFIVIDDDSEEDIKGVLNSEKVIIFKPLVGDFKTSKTIWIKLLLKAFQQPNSWVLTVDSDEFLSLKGTASNLQNYCMKLDKENRKFVSTLLIDMLPNETLDLNEFTGKDFISKFDKFYCGNDVGGEKYSNLPPIKWAFDDYWKYSYRLDARWHFFNTIDSLRKFPLFKYNNGLLLNQGFHDIKIDNVMMSPELAFVEKEFILPLKHYKMVKLFINNFDKNSISSYHDRTSKNIKKIVATSPLKFKQDVDLDSACIIYEDKVFNHLLSGPPAQNNRAPLIVLN